MAPLPAHAGCAFAACAMTRPSLAARFARATRTSHRSFPASEAQLSDETTALCDLLATHFGVLLASIEQEIKGATIPHGLAAVLEAKPGDTALSILRRYRDPSGWVFLVTVGLHPADRFAYRMRLERTTSPAEPAGAA